MKRGKPKPKNEYSKYIEQITANLISSAGAKYERFIKKQVSDKKTRKMLVQRCTEERQVIEKRMLEKSQRER